MGEAFEQDVAPFSVANIGAAAILTRTEHGNLHSGLVFRGTEGSIGFLHLAWEDRLSDQWSLDRRWLWASPTVEPERLNLVAGMCRRAWKIYKREHRFPYALRFGGSSFDDAGRLLLAEGARGLTCATFILAIFSSVGIDLIDEHSWPCRRAEDERFLEFLTAYATPEHMEILRLEVANGLKRIWPDEVLGACTNPTIPVDFVAARAAADPLLSRLGAAADGATRPARTRRRRS